MIKSTPAFLTILILLSAGTLRGQGSGPVLNDFTLPAQVCVGEPVNITNLSQGVSTWFWSFCKTSQHTIPGGMNLGNPGNTLSLPYYISLAEDAGEFYSFITNKTDGSIIRIYHKKSLIAPPVSATSLGNFNVLNSNLNGIQVLKSGTKWYGFVVNNNTIRRLDFGTSLQNMPLLITLGTTITPSTVLNGLLIQEDGGSYYGFITDQLNNTLLRLTFGTNLESVPVTMSLGNVGSLNMPAQLILRKYDTAWCMLICNEGDSTISQIRFGSSLLNPPTGQNLGKLGGLAGNRGLSLVAECNDLNDGYALNYNSAVNPLSKLDLNGGVCGTVTGMPAGNPAGLDQPSIFSQWVRIGDTLFALATNMGNSTLSLLYSADCQEATVHTSTLEDPPPYSYLAPGTYKVLLITDDGTATEQQVCKQIDVIPSPVINLGNDTVTCIGQTITLSAGLGYSNYSWSTGATTSSIVVNKTGTYWVGADGPNGCTGRDTINVTFTAALTGSLDTLLCYGTPYFAGGNWQTTAGTYQDTVNTASGCDSILTTTLTYKAEIPVNLGNDRHICPGEEILLSASVPGASYLWQNGSTDSTFLATETGTYWVDVTKDSCTVADTLVLTDCPAELWFPNAFSPNEDGRNDVFRPKGVSISKYHLYIYDRWGTLLFETDNLDEGWKGIYKGLYCPAGVYVYKVSFEGTDDPGKTRTMSGSFNLVR